MWKFFWPAELFLGPVCLYFKVSVKWRPFQLFFEGIIKLNRQKLVRGTLLSTEERAKIDALFALKKTVTEISKVIKRSRRSVSRYLASPENYGKNVGGARNKKMTPNDLRVLSPEVSKGHFSAASIKKRGNIPVSLHRVQQLLYADATVSLKSFKKLPPLTQEHKKNRLTFARNQHDWTPSQWGRIVFSDEKRFCLDGPDGRHNLSRISTVLDGRISKITRLSTQLL